MLICLCWIVLTKVIHFHLKFDLMKRVNETYLCTKGSQLGLNSDPTYMFLRNGYLAKYTVKSTYKELIGTIMFFFVTGVPYKRIVNLFHAKENQFGSGSFSSAGFL